MKRAVLAVALAALSVAVWTQVPARSIQDVGVVPDPVLPSTAGCPVVTGRNAESTLAFASATVDRVDVIAANSGSVTAFADLEIGNSGGATIGVLDFVGASDAAVVADLPNEGAAMAVVTRSPAIITAGQCSPPSSREVVVAGVSTASGESLDLVLANPYANDAVVAVRTSSEAGRDSASELESVIVPARSVVSVELSTLLPLRQRLAVRVIAQRGTVHVAGVQRTTFERMYIEGVSPAREWYLPIPDTGSSPIIVIAATGPTGANYRIDTFGPAGEVTGVVTGEIAVDEHAVVDASTLGDDVRAVRVSTDSEVVASVVIESETIRAGTPGVPEVAGAWLVPGAFGDGAVLRIANPSAFTADVTIQSLVEGGSAQTISVEPGTTAEVLSVRTWRGLFGSISDRDLRCLVGQRRCRLCARRGYPRRVRRGGLRRVRRSDRGQGRGRGGVPGGVVGRCVRRTPGDCVRSSSGTRVRSRAGCQALHIDHL